MNDDATQTLTLADLLAFAQRYAIAVAAAAVAAGALAYVISSFMPDVYESRTSVLASQTNPEFRQFGVGIATAAPMDVQIYRAAALTPDVLEDARVRAAAAGIEDVPSLGALRGAITITTEELYYSSLLNVAVRHGDPIIATRLADAVAGAMIGWDQRRARSAIDDLVRNLTMQIQALDSQIRELGVQTGVSQDQITGRINLRAEQQEQLYYARVLANSASGLLTVLQRAELPGSPVAPRPTRNAMLAAALAAALVLLTGLLRELLDTRVKDIDGITRVTGLPLLATFPLLNDESRRAPKEAANFLRANLAFTLADAHPKVIVVTSAVPTEGKTTVAVGLAESYARQDYRVLLVDGDLRRPMVATVLSIPLSEARIDWAMERSDEPLPVRTVELEGATTMDVLAATNGIDRPAERIAMGIASLLARAAEIYDVVVFDSAPVLAVADALPLVTSANATLLAVSVGRSGKRQVAHALDVLRRANARLAGVVATHAPQPTRRSAGGYGAGYGYDGYGYGYGYGAKPREDIKEAPAQRPAATLKRTKP